MSSHNDKKTVTSEIEVETIVRKPIFLLGNEFFNRITSSLAPILTQLHNAITNYWAGLFDLICIASFPFNVKILRGKLFAKSEILTLVIQILIRYLDHRLINLGLQNYSLEKNVLQQV
jgi:hypothetical protein